MNAPNTPSRLALALVDLNALPRRKGKGRPLTEADFLTLEQAKERTQKAGLNGWSKDSVFIRVETLVELYSSLTNGGRRALANDELIGGWFEEQGDDECDEDGEFCSTPSHNDEVPSVADYEEDLEWCSREGILFVY